MYDDSITILYSTSILLLLQKKEGSRRLNYLDPLFATKKILSASLLTFCVLEQKSPYTLTFSKPIPVITGYKTQWNTCVDGDVHQNDHIFRAHPSIKRLDHDAFHLLHHFQYNPKCR